MQDNGLSVVPYDLDSSLAKISVLVPKNFHVMSGSGIQSTTTSELNLIEHTSFMPEALVIQVHPIARTEKVCPCITAIL